MKQYKEPVVCSSYSNGAEIVSLACNSIVKQELERRGIEAKLWEDFFEEQELVELHTKLKEYTHEWYLDGNNNDVSRFDGFSMGNAISIYAYWDLESWIRLFFLFEKFARNGISCKFYVSSLHYLPDIFDDFIEKAKEAYHTNIDIINLGLENGLDEGTESIEPEVGYLLSCNRSQSGHKRNKKKEVINSLMNFISLFSKKNNAPFRVYCHFHSVDFGQYLKSFYDNGFYKYFKLYYDIYSINYKSCLQFLPKHSFVPFTNNGSYQPGEKNLREINNYLERVAAFLEKSDILRDLTFPISQQVLKPVFVQYFLKSLSTQLHKYVYFLGQFRKYNINLTINTAWNNPEACMFKHLMDSLGGKSFYLPHGITGFKLPSDTNFKSAAHYFFQYSASEIKSLSAIYNIHKDRFLKTGFRKLRDYQRDYSNITINKSRLLVLGDIYCLSLLTKINLAPYYKALYQMLFDMGFSNITLRVHPSITMRAVEKFVQSIGLGNNVKLEEAKKIKLWDSLKDKDLVIGQFSSSIYEAMCSKVFSVTFIPNNITFDYKKDSQIYWFSELYPEPAKTLSVLKNQLHAFFDDPINEYQKYLQSIQEVGLFADGKNDFWSSIYSKVK